MATLAKVRSPIIAEAVRLAEPISPVYCNRAMAKRFRHYERWRARLDGFIAVGDSLCAFNPVYGQGMTSAAVTAQIPNVCIKRAGPRAARRLEYRDRHHRALRRDALARRRQPTSRNETEKDSPRRHGDTEEAGFETHIEQLAGFHFQ